MGVGTWRANVNVSVLSCSHPRLHAGVVVSTRSIHAHFRVSHCLHAHVCSPVFLAYARSYRRMHVQEKKRSEYANTIDTKPASKVAWACVHPVHIYRDERASVYKPTRIRVHLKADVGGRGRAKGQGGRGGMRQHRRRSCDKRGARGGE